MLDKDKKLKGKIIKDDYENKLSSNLEDITYRELDGKINPKEPVYCFCNYISHGNMVKCDNPKVKN